jgi:site-specific DNA-methyltransferase (cytosine-N4-specific)
MIDIREGDCMDVLPTMATYSVQTVITSPPYFQHRDYSNGSWEGGDPGCDHQLEQTLHRAERPRNGLTGNLATVDSAMRAQRPVCASCGARRASDQLGMEDSPGEYVDKLVDIFKEIRPVLRDDGTVWLNLGDTYRDKSLLGMPWRVAHALQDDGWLIRNEIVWNKLAPMPEAVKDRLTVSHELMFLLTKKPTYFYDSTAIREGGQEGGRNRRDVWSMASDRFPDTHFAVMPKKLVLPCVLAGSSVCACGKCGTPWHRTDQGWEPGCDEMDPTGHSLVMDPFAGSGTVGVVCSWLDRHFVGIELNHDYAELARMRIMREGRLGANHQPADVGEDQLSMEV